MFLITNILLYVLLLYECSGYISRQLFSYNLNTISNSNSKIYSDFFISNQFLSHKFLSHKFLSHNQNSYSKGSNNVYSDFFISNQFLSHKFLSHKFLSHKFLSHKFLSQQFLSHSKQFKTCNNYLTIIYSYQQYKSYNSNTVFPSYIKTMSSYTSNTNNINIDSIKMLTMVQSYYSQINSATIYSKSVINSIILRPTLAPTQEPSTEHSLKPSINPKENEEPFISFTTDLSLSNVQSEYLDLLAQKSVTLAQALTMNISSDFVTFVSSSVSKQKNLNKNSINPKMLSYNLVVTTKTNIILQGKYSVFLSNPQALFTTLSTSMTNLGVFTQNLVTISLQMNSTATASAVLSSVYVSNPIIQINNTNFSVTPTAIPTPFITLNPTSNSKNSGKENYNSSALIIFVSCVSVIVGLNICYIVYLFFKRRYLRFLRRRQNDTNLLNTDNIEIRFV